MSEWKEYLNNPSGRHVGDCAVRAISKAIGEDWDRAYAELALTGFTLKDMPSSDATINSLLRQYGFKRQIVPNTCPDCYTIADFANDHPTGTFIVATGNHVVCIENGTVWDSWNSLNEVPIYFWEEDTDTTEETEGKTNGI